MSNVLEMPAKVLGLGERRRRSRSRARAAARLGGALTAGAVMLGFAASASADLQIQPGSFSVTTSAAQAGAHADLTTSFAFVSNPDGTLTDHPKDIVVDLPVGFSGQETGIPACPLSDFSGNNCSTSTQVGAVTIVVTPIFGPFAHITLPVFNLQPNFGETAKFGFSLFGIGTQGVISVRPGDYGLRTTIHNVNGGLDLDGSTLTLWGVPADPRHDAQRGQSCLNTFCFGGGHPAGVAAVPFLRNPTTCSGTPLAATLSVNSWENPGAQQTATANTGPFSGCDALRFAPRLTVQPAVAQADSPAGYTIDLKNPQNENPASLATPDLRQAVVQLPRGVALSPPAANGLKACTDAQVGLGAGGPPACPDGAKLGSAVLTTPALPDQLTGWIYLAGPDSGPITGPPYRIFLTLSGDGVQVKLVGTVTPDPVTGQLTTTFADNPQLPFSELKLQLFGGPQAALVNPTSCGSFTTTSDLTPWSAPDSGPDATPSDSFAITGCGDPNAFAPTFAAGSSDRQAGASGGFTLTFSRSDADQPLSSLSLTLPPGVLAKLAGVALCTDSDANAGSCPAASQVGTVETGAGAGSQPLFLPGKAYLTGPYKGAPYGLAVVVPAIAGPFDLGNVVVRSAIRIDPTDAHVTVTSDPFPTMLGGIPLQLRRVDVNLNRPGFMVNPTSCDPMSIGGVLASTGGRDALASSPFQVGGCQELGFSPKLGIALSGNGRTRSGAHPNLTATLNMPGGQANIKTAKVALPLSLALDPNNSQHVCNYDVANAVHGGAVGCPASTIVGTATAQTPLLDKPLTGNVYLVQGIRFGPDGQRIRTLPSLLVPLRGQIALDLRASSTVNGAQQLVTTFSTIPDAPVSKFKLSITGGPKGLLVITGRGKSICTGPQVANGDFGAQSGKTNSQNDTMATPCGTPARLRVLSHRVKGHSLVVRVATSERGRLTVTGQGLRPYSRLVGAGTHTIQVALKHHAARKHSAHTASMQVQVTLTPANAQGTTHTFRQRE